MVFSIKSPTLEWEITLGPSSIEFVVLGCSHKNWYVCLVVFVRLLKAATRWLFGDCELFLPERPQGRLQAVLKAAGTRATILDKCSIVPVPWNKFNTYEGGQPVHRLFPCLDS